MPQQTVSPAWARQGAVKNLIQIEFYLNKIFNNEELARIEAEAWEELSCGKAEEGTSTRKVPHLKIRDYSKPFSENVTTVKNAPLHNFTPRTSLLTDIPKSSVQIDRPFPVTFAELPDQDLRIKVKNSSFSQKPESQFKSKFDYRNTEQA